ncbi:hypothetical protein BaRGS_00039669 [Batillaria attramentaria]|uniref:Uncharacterized protein n=1 Tax=Batillaria attramentaria TaxID=370345 RepID=A0ABD0J3F8_9CAEN
MDFVTVEGHPTRIMWSQRGSSIRYAGVGSVFIQNLDKSIDDKARHDNLSAFCNILSCKVACHDHSSKVHWSVHFETEQAVKQENVNVMLLDEKR